MRTIIVKETSDYSLTLSVVNIDAPKNYVELTITESSDFGVNQNHFYLTEEELQNFAGALLNNES